MSTRRSWATVGLIGVLAVLSACGSTTGSATRQVPAATLTTTVLATSGVETTVTETETEAVTETVTVTETETETVTAEAGAADPGGTGDGWTDAGNGVRYGPADTESFECSFGREVCWGVVVVAADGCPAGVKVTATAYPPDNTDQLSLIESSITSPVAAGAETVLVLESSQAEQDWDLTVDSVGCL